MSAEPPRPPTYLLRVLLDGATPFGYRPILRDLLGGAAGGPAHRPPPAAEPAFPYAIASGPLDL
ncbi:MAG: hypothetical protein HGA45_36290, partial [Chloroflexales bacterium]|nr:hypothetical protein [Chloroflexales bacterium]